MLTPRWQINEVAFVNGARPFGEVYGTRPLEHRVINRIAGRNLFETKEKDLAANAATASRLGY